MKMAGYVGSMLDEVFRMYLKQPCPGCGGFCDKQPIHALYRTMYVALRAMSVPAMTRN